MLQHTLDEQCYNLAWREDKLEQFQLYLYQQLVVANHEFWHNFKMNFALCSVV